MSLLRRTRTEVAGAWRSLRYDLGRAPAEPPAGGPDVTSTGMATFGGVPLEESYAGRPVPADGHRRPRRALAVTAFGTLTVLGAAGAYLAVVNGLGSLLAETTAAADTVPQRPAVTTDARAGAGPVQRPAGRPAAPGTVARPVLPGAAGTTVAGLPAAPPPPPTVAGRPAQPAAPAAPAAPVRTTKAGEPECRCVQPPVPTPTAPASSPSPTPSPSPSDSASPSPTESSTTPSASAQASESWQGRRHHRRHG